jgi:hypothetical protein
MDTYPLKIFKYKNIIKILKLSLIGITILLFFTLILMNYDHTHFNGFSKESDIEYKFFNRLYFATTTFSSTGYGDLSPKSVDVKIISMILQFSLVIIMLGGTFELNQ